MCDYTIWKVAKRIALANKLVKVASIQEYMEVREEENNKRM